MNTITVSTPELHRRIRRARLDLEEARINANPSYARAAERTMNQLLDALCERLAPHGFHDRVA